MGTVQIEVLTSLIKERFGFDISFDSGSIVYKETIENICEGVGHFEPVSYTHLALIIKGHGRTSVLSMSAYWLMPKAII